MRDAIAFLSAWTWHWRPTKQIQGLRGNETYSNMMNHGALSLGYSGIQNMHMLISVLATKDKKRVDARVLAAA